MTKFKYYPLLIPLYIMETKNIIYIENYIKVILKKKIKLKLNNNNINKLGIYTNYLLGNSALEFLKYKEKVLKMY